jgi:hypothetical protein
MSLIYEAHIVNVSGLHRCNKLVNWEGTGVGKARLVVMAYVCTSMVPHYLDGLVGNLVADWGRTFCFPSCTAVPYCSP